MRVLHGQRQNVEVGGHEIGRDARHVVAVLREAVRQRLTSTVVSQFAIDSVFNQSSIALLIL